MGRFGIVTMLPREITEEEELDFIAQEFDSIEELVQVLLQLEETHPNWRLITFCHIDELPLLIEPLRKTFGSYFRRPKK